MVLTTPYLSIQLLLSHGQQNLMEVAAKVFKVTSDDQGRFTAYREDADKPFITSATSAAKAADSRQLCKCVP